MFNGVIQKKLDDSVPKLALNNSREHIPFSDSVETDSSQFPEDNYHMMPDDTAVFEKHNTDQWINAEMDLPPGDLLRLANIVGRICLK